MTNPIIKTFSAMLDKDSVRGEELEELKDEYYHEIMVKRGDQDEFFSKLVGFARDTSQDVTPDHYIGKWGSYIVAEMLLKYFWASLCGYIQSDKDIHTIAWYKKAVHITATC